MSRNKDIARIQDNLRVIAAIQGGRADICERSGTTTVCVISPGRPDQMLVLDKSQSRNVRRKLLRDMARDLGL